MKIVIATPSYPPRVAGPSHYAKGVEAVWRAEGHEVVVVSFDAYLHLPSGVRHLAYAAALIGELRSASFVFALDIFSVAVPAVLVAKLFRKKCIVRVSGDFIWEGYVERGGEEVTLKEFYARREMWSWREHLLFRMSGWALNNASGLVFQNTWQQSLVLREFSLSRATSAIIRNNFPQSVLSSSDGRKIFLWAGRVIRLKNVERMKQAFAEAEAIDPSIELRMYSSLSRDELFSHMRSAYVVMNPSLSDMNPNIVLEGIAVGKPFICTEESGIREVTEGMGLFVNPKSVAEIRDAILELSQAATYDRCRSVIASRTGVREYCEVARELFAFAESI